MAKRAYFNLERSLQAAKAENESLQKDRHFLKCAQV